MRVEAVKNADGLPHSTSFLCEPQALYSWWQYDLCDVFIELVKPAVQQPAGEPGADAERSAYRQTLWTCLDNGLRCGTLPLHLEVALAGPNMGERYLLAACDFLPCGIVRARCAQLP